MSILIIVYLDITLDNLCVFFLLLLFIYLFYSIKNSTSGLCGVLGTCMQRRGRRELASFDPKIERTTNRLRRERRVLEAHNRYLVNMAENLQQNPNLREENELQCGNRRNNNARRPVV